MSCKTYPWNTHYAPLSHRGRKEGRQQRLLAAEEHLARRVYDELNKNSPHPHICHPCRGLDPKKVRDGKCGRNAYILTARALIEKSPLKSYLDAFGLNITKPNELVPLLRRCTDPKDGHIDWPKLVRHIVALYYISLIDPDWLFFTLTTPGTDSESRNAEHALEDILPFYLFRPQPIRCFAEYPIPDMNPVSMPDASIFKKVDTKLRHVIQNQKDDGDRANWHPYEGEFETAEQAAEGNLYRLYGGNPETRMQRDALNELRDEGRLLTATQPPETNRQAQRVKAARDTLTELDETADKIEQYENWLEGCYRELAQAQANKEKSQLENKAQGLEKAIASKKRQYRYLQKREWRLWRSVQVGHIPYFHSLESLVELNREQVDEYMSERAYERQYVLPKMTDVVATNYKAGQKGEASVQSPIHLINYEFTPHWSLELHSIVLLGAIAAYHFELKRGTEKVTMPEFAKTHRDDFQKELAEHGVIRHAVLHELLHYDEILANKREEFDAIAADCGVPPLTHLPQYDLILRRLGFADIEAIKALGEDYFERSRTLYKRIARLDALTPDEVQQAQEAYRTKINYMCGRVIRS